MLTLPGALPPLPCGSSPGKAGNARTPAPRQSLDCWHTSQEKNGIETETRPGSSGRQGKAAAKRNGQGGREKEKKGETMQRAIFNDLLLLFP